MARRYVPGMKVGQVGGWVWWMSILWVVLGGAGSLYIFFLSTHIPVTTSCDLTPCWVGESGVFVGASKLGAAAWLLLTIPVLVIGLIRLRRTGARAGAWIAGVALMFWVADWQTSAPGIDSCNHSSGCVLIGYSQAVVSWVQLPICAAFLALGAAITLVLAGEPYRSTEKPSALA